MSQDVAATLYRLEIEGGLICTPSQNIVIIEFVYVHVQHTQSTAVEVLQDLLQQLYVGLRSPSYANVQVSFVHTFRCSELYIIVYVFKY